MKKQTKYWNFTDYWLEIFDDKWKKRLKKEDIKILKLDFAEIIRRTRDDEKQKLRGIIDKEIERIEKETRSRIRDSVNSGRIDGLYFIGKALKKKL